MTSFRSFFVVSFILIVIIAGCSTLDKDTVARVPAMGEAGEWNLSLEDFREISKGRWGSLENAKMKSMDDHIELVESMVIKRLKTVDGIQKGFDKDPLVQKEYENNLNRAALSELYSKEIRDKIITEKEVREYYDNDKEEIKASHILLTSEKYDDNSAKKLLSSLREQLISGSANFSDLARKYSMDKTTPDGDIGWFRWGKMVEEFQQAAFDLNTGDISEPVKTSYGWHLIKLEGRRKLENIKSFEETKDQIISQMTRQRSEELRTKSDEYLNNLKEQGGYQFNLQNAARIVGKINDKNSIPALAMFTEEEQNLPLASLNDGTIITIKDVIPAEGEMRRTPMIQDVNKMDQVATFYAAEFFLLPKVAREAGYYELESSIMQAERARDGKILQLVQQKIVVEKADTYTDEEVLKHYNDNTDKFMKPAEFTLVEILLSSESKAKELAEKIKNGENMRELAAQYTERTQTKDKQGVLGPIKENQYGEIGKTAATAEIGVLNGPIQLESSKKWSIFKVISKEEPKIREFEEIKNKVENDYKMLLRGQYEEEWVNSLKKAIPYKINKKAIKTAFADVKLKKSDVENAPENIK